MGYASCQASCYAVTLALLRSIPDALDIVREWPCLVVLHMVVCESGRRWILEDDENATDNGWKEALNGLGEEAALCVDMLE